MDIEVDIMGSEAAQVQDCIPSTQAAAGHDRVDGCEGLVHTANHEVIEVEDLRQDDKHKGVSYPEFLEVGSEKLNLPPEPQANTGFDIHIEEGVTMSITSTTGNVVQQPTSQEENPKLSGASYENDPSNSSRGASLKPDFSILTGEIHLDNLSVKALQETFKASFGRETSVKDKQWLKRRIIMGLTNSCDFSISTLAMIDNRIVKKVSKETFEGIDCSYLVDCPVTSEMEIHETSSSFYDERDKILSVEDELPLPSSNLERGCVSKDVDMEQRSAKRVRKPTRRYIEELSEGKPMISEAKSFSSIRNRSLDLPLKVCAKPVHNVGLHDGSLIRKDSLGGSGVQIPYVSRIRRSRPREDFATLMLNVFSCDVSKIQSSHAVLPLDSRKNDEYENERDDESKNEMSKRRFSHGWTADPPADDPSETDKPFTERTPTHPEKQVKPKNTLTDKNTSDEEDITTTPTDHGGMRRKHHMPWTLTEVVKLVEGVAKYGSGRWSEIKRLSFASYSYRTSVDLKDKWRNLLKASLAEPPSGNEMHASRRQTSAPIPTQIMSRVRELADVQLVVSPILGSAKLSVIDNDGRTVDDTQSGFL